MMRDYKNKNSELPFSLIAGSGLGISHTALTNQLLPASKSFGSANINCAANMISGNLFVQDILLSFPDTGTSIGLGYIFNSQAKDHRWQLAAGRKIKTVVKAQSITIIEADGRENYYLYDEKTNTYIASECDNEKTYIKLDEKSDTCNLFYPDSNKVESFDKKGNISSVVDQVGSKTSYQHDESNRLTAIVAPSGMRYEIRRSNQKIEVYLAKDKSVLLHTYLLDSNGNLIKSVTPDHYEINYQYDRNGYLEKVIQSDSTILQFSYKTVSEIEKLASIQAGSDTVNTYNFDYGLNNTTSLIDPSGIQNKLIYNESYPLSFSTNKESLKYKFNEHGQITNQIYPDQSEEQFDYDKRTGLITQHIRRDGGVVKYFYSMQGTRPLLTCKAEFANSVNEVPIQYTHYVYDTQFKNDYAVLRFEISSSGRVKEYLSNTNGQIESERKFIDHFYKHEGSYQDSPKLLAMENWLEKISNNLTNKIELVKYGYDAQGRVNGITKCSHSNNSQDYAVAERYAYDDRGNIILKSIKTDENKFLNYEYAFNFLGQKTKEIVGAGSVLAQQSRLEQTANKIIKTLPNGRKEIETINSAGVLESVTAIVQVEKGNEQERKEQITYYPKERVNVIHHFDGTKAIEFYDDNQRLIATVSPSGAIVKYSYCIEARSVTKTEYEGNIDINSLFTTQSTLSYYLGYRSEAPSYNLLDKILKEKDLSNKNRTHQTFKGFRDEIRYEIGPKNSLIEYQHDSLGNKIHTIVYKSEITHEELVLLKTGKSLSRIPDRKVDRIHSVFYDSDGYEIATQDPAGYLTEFRRNGVAHTKEKINYEEPVLDFANQFTEIQSKLSKKTTHSYYFYNTKSECDLEIDQEGYITSHSFYNDGKLQHSIRYERKVDSGWYANKDLRPHVLTAANDEKTTYDYDELRRLSCSYTSSGKVTTFSYDEMNNTIGKHVATKDNVNKTADSVRGTESSFDKWGQKVAFVNPFVVQMLDKLEFEKLEAQEKELRKKEIFKKFSERDEYNDLGLRVKSYDVYGNATVYFYDQARRPIVSINPEGCVVLIELNSFGEIEKEHKFATKLSEQERKSLKGSFLDANLENLLKKITNKEKDVITRFEYDLNGQVIRKIDPKGFIYEYKYDNFKQCIWEATPINDNNLKFEIEHKYDQRGLEIETKKSAENKKPIIITKKYNNCFGSLTGIFDESGCHAVYGYDKVGNHTETLTQAEDNDYLLTKKVDYDALGRPIRITNADNETLTIEYDQINRSKTIKPLNKQEKTVITSNVFGEDILITHYDADGVILQQESLTHAPDGQILHHKKGDQTLNSTIYDLLGRIESEINSHKVKTEYKRNNAGQIHQKIVDADQNGLHLTTSYSPNAFGLNEKIKDPKGIVTENEFDQNGNLTESLQDPIKEKHVTTYTHNAQGNQTGVMQGDDKNKSQTLEKKVFDEFNRLKQITIIGKDTQFTTQYEHDAAGNVIKEITPNGDIKRAYYNVLNQLRYEIFPLNDHEIGAREYLYTDAGKLKSVRVYSLGVKNNLINDETKLTDLKSLFQKSQNDSVTQFYYDDQGREQFNIKLVYSYERKKLEAIVSEKQYDAVGREIKSINYQQYLDASQNDSLTSATLSSTVANLNSDKIQILYTSYDTAGRERFKIDQNGAVLEKRYNEAGQLIAQISYFNSIPDIAAISPINVNFILSALKPDKRDRANYFAYDSVGRLQYLVKPNGVVIKKDHDENGKEIQLCQFKDQIDMDQPYEQLVKALNTLIPDRKTDAVTTTEYNSVGEAIKIIDALGNEETFEHDSRGNLTRHKDKAGYIWEYEFDCANRLVSEISPETTITQVERDPTSGKLVSKEIKTKVIKKTDYDKNGNAAGITEGFGLPEQRAINFQYDFRNQIIGTDIPNVFVDDGSNYKDAWKNFKGLPEKSETIISKNFYNANGKKIADINENGVWSYYVYDSAERLILEIKNQKKVTKYSYNALGQVTAEIAFDNQIEINPEKTDLKEITFEFFSALIKPSEHDRTKLYEYNSAGKLVGIKTTVVPYYSDGEFGAASPQFKKEYNIFGECNYEAQLIRPGVWAEKFSWLDKLGRPVITIDENKYVTQYVYTTNGKIALKVDYEKPFFLPFTKDTAVEDIEKNISKSLKDRYFEYEYNQLDQVKSESQYYYDWDKKKKFFQYQELDQNNKPSIVNREKECFKKEFNYDQRGKLTCIAYDDGRKEYKYYDSRGVLCAETEATHTNVHGNNAKVTPLKKYGVDAFGQTVVTEQSDIGCDLPNIDKEPSFINQSNISKEILLIDSRGLTKFKQDAEENVTAFTWSRSKKATRQIQQVKIWHKDGNPKLGNLKAFENNLDETESPLIYKGAAEGWVRENETKLKSIDLQIEQGAYLSASIDNNKALFAPEAVNFTQAKHIDEKKIAYDEFDRPVQVNYLREGVSEETIYSKYNTFGEFIGEGLDNKSWPLFKNVDASGNSSTFCGADGVKTRACYDLRGLETLRFQSTESDVTSNSVNDILKWDPKTFERTESNYDLSGKLTSKKAPLWFKDRNTLPTRQYKWDRWGNITKEIDSFGHEIDSEFDWNKLATRVQQEVNVVNENGISERKRPVTKYYYNTAGFHIATTDANNHTEAYALDEAGQCVTKTLPEGTKIERKIYDALGNPIVTIDARDKQWKYKYDRTGRHTETKFPSGRTITTDYDGKGGISSVTESSNTKTRFNNDVRGNTWEKYLPLGQLNRTVSDRNGQPVIFFTATNSMTWKRDYFGNILEHVDLSKIVYIHDLNFKNQPRRQYSTNASNRTYLQANLISKNVDGSTYPLFSYNSSFPPVPLQDIEFSYENGFLVKINDKGLKQITTNSSFDNEGRHRQVNISRYDGTLLSEVKSEFDELGREQRIENKNLGPAIFYDILISEIGYDAVGNKRVISVTVDPSGFDDSCRMATQQVAYWYLYDEADRILIENGELINKGISITDQQGLKFTYADGLRKTETRGYTKPIVASLTYNDDALLDTTEAKSENKVIATSKRDYNQFGFVGNYQESFSKESTKKVLAGVNKNHWVEGEETWENNSLKTATRTSFSEDGLPVLRETTYPGDPKILDRNELLYGNFDSLQLMTVTAKRLERGPRGNYHVKDQNTASFYYDANKTLCGKVNSEDEERGTNVTRDKDFIAFDRTSDGLVINKQIINTARNKKYQFLRNINNEILGGFSNHYIKIKAFAHHGAYHVKHTGYGAKPEISSFVLHQPAHPVAITAPRNKEAKLNPLDWDDVQSDLGHHPYVVNHGDTLASICKKLYGDTSYVNKVAEVNGLIFTEEKLKPGLILHTPQFIGMHNKSDTSQPYNEFLKLMSGSLSPRLITPQPKIDRKRNWIGTLIRLIAIAIVLVVAPYLAVGVLEAVGITAGMTAFGMSYSTLHLITTGVVAALGDAAIQGVAIGLGQQANFSIAEMLETGVTGGVGASLPAVDSWTKAAEAAFKVGSAAVATQLIEMEAGLRDKFDARAIAMQVSAMLVGSQISKAAHSDFVKNNFGEGVHVNAASAAISTTTNAVLGHGITGAPIDVQNIAMNTVGSTVSSSLAQKLSKNNKAELEFENNENLVSDPKLDISREAINTARTEMNISKAEKWNQESKNRGTFNQSRQDLPVKKSAANILVEKANEQAGNGESYSYLDNSTPFTKTVVYGGTAAAAVLFIPAAVGTAMGAVGTSMLLGPIVEGTALGILGDAVLLQTVGRFGVAVSASSLISKAGFFGSRIKSTADTIRENIAVSKLGRQKSNFSVQVKRETALDLEFKAKRTAGLNNDDARDWYKATVEPIDKLNEQWIRHGISLEDRAFKAYAIRHDARLKSRDLMSKLDGRQEIEVRDMEKYGDIHGPNFKNLYAKYESQGYKGNEIYQLIIEKAQTTNPEYNNKFGQLKLRS